MKILVADDLKENRYLLESALKSQGYEVFSAANGLKALEILNEKHVDLIISDVLMPKMDGFQLCREVKSDKKLKKIPFIFYTASYTTPEDQKFGLDIGAEKYIIKPIDPYNFLKIISDVLRNADKIEPSEPLIKKEFKDIYLQGYNSRIFGQLEKKIEQLEEKNKKLIESQKALKESEKKYYLLYNSIMDAVLFYEINQITGCSTGKILEANRTACKKLGYSREELIQMNIQDIYTKFNGNNEKHKTGSIDENGRFSFETEMIRKDGKLFPVYVKSDIVEMQDRIYRISLNRDLTAEKESRNREMEALKNIEKNLAQNAILNDGIRNPLTVISGFVSIENIERKKEILEQVKIIDNIISEVDKGWLESAKIREFLKKHYNFGEEH
ncbi:MAG: response regulator [Methanomicrobium sp.]|nr:response regulator [Methanomicrobium sp.]